MKLQCTLLLLILLQLTTAHATAVSAPYRAGIYRNVKIPNPEVQQAEQQRIQDSIASGLPLKPPGPLNRFRPKECPQTIQFSLPARRIPFYAPVIRAFRSEDLIIDGIQCDSGETFILKSDPLNPQVRSGRYISAYFFSAVSNFNGNLHGFYCGTRQFRFYGATITTPRRNFARLKAGVTYITPNFKLPSGASGYCTMEFVAEGTDVDELELAPFPRQAGGSNARTTASVYRRTMLRNPEAEMREDVHREAQLANGVMEPIPRLNTFRPRVCPGSLQFSLQARSMGQFAPSVKAFTSSDFVFDSVRCDMNETYIIQEDLANPLRIQGRYSHTWFFFATSNLDGVPNRFKCGNVEHSFFGGLISIPARDFMGLKAGVAYLTLNLALENDRSSYCTMEFVGLGKVAGSELAPFPVAEQTGDAVEEPAQPTAEPTQRPHVSRSTRTRMVTSAAGPVMKSVEVTVDRVRQALDRKR